MTLAVVDFTSYTESITEALDSINAKETLAGQSSILLKPNLINDSPHPVTTPVECCKAVIEYIRSYSNDMNIVIAEGCGSTTLETDEVFDALGYCDLAESYSDRLVDLNKEPLQKVENSDCPYFPQMYLPEIAFTHFIISIPVLKVHSIATYTGALKNMVGFAPPKYYSGNYGSWKKAVFHGDIHQSIIDLISYRSPDLSIIDATIGLSEFHLGGAQCNPPVNKIIAGFDPFEVDRKAADFLGLNWREIGHLSVRLK
jgi:uncharacterized protein (DUF362 family)